jgi:hypothetical protein
VTDAGHDAATPDRSPPPPPDAGDSPAKIDAKPPLCSPAEVSTFTPAPVSPVFFSDCTEAQISAIVAACLANGTTSACGPLLNEAANKTCAGCIYLPYSSMPIRPGQNPVPPAATLWGPVIQVLDSHGGGVTFPNTGACISMADPSQTQCAEALTATLQCEIASCGANCPLLNSKQSETQNTNDSNAFDACTELASRDACSVYGTAAQRDCASVQSGPASACLALIGSSDPSALAAAYTKLIRLQCAIGDASTTDVVVHGGGG